MPADGLRGRDLFLQLNKPLFLLITIQELWNPCVCDLWYKRIVVVIFLGPVGYQETL